MKPEQQRIAIAEACGWTDISEPNWCGSVFGRYKSDQSPLIKIPDYLNDLNAMHEAMRKLTDYQRLEFREHLSHIWRRDYNACCGIYPRHDDSVNTTATQRAEAFLRAIQKWTK